MRYFLVSVLALAAGCAPSTSSVGSPPAVQLAHGSGGENADGQLKKPYVIIVSFDGFRADYLDRYSAPNFMRVARSGVRAAMIPVFPSKTYPNHYSIVTGDYPATHGIVANRFWDPSRTDLYAMGDKRAVTDGTWYRGEPIWVTAERQGMVTASYDWYASEAAIEGILPSRYTVYGRDSVSNAAKVDTLLVWLARPPRLRPHFLAMYFSDVDHAGHDYGPNDHHVQAAISGVDSALGRLLDGVGRLPIGTDTYVILVSDHGMTETSPSTYVRTTDVIDTAGIRIGDGGPVANLYVAGGMSRARIVRDSLNRHLAHGHAYLREDVPERFHYRSDPRIGDVVVIMDEHWQFGGRMPTKPGGQHGYDNRLASMRAIFLATGPGIRAGSTIAPFENIQVYSLMTELLGLSAAHDIDGKPGWLRHRIMQ